MKKIIKKVSIFFFVAFSFLIQIRAYAQGPALVPGSEAGAQDEKYLKGNYEVNDFIVVAISVSKWILIVAGSLSLLAFIVGGLMFILSAGNREWVEKGKASLIGATIGLVVVLLAFTAVSYFMDTIGYVEGDNWSTAAPPG